MSLPLIPPCSGKDQAKCCGYTILFLIFWPVIIPVVAVCDCISYKKQKNQENQENQYQSFSD